MYMFSWDNSGILGYGPQSYVAHSVLKVLAHGAVHNVS